MKKLWSHGWFAALLAGVAFLLIPTVSAGADTSTTIQGRAPAAVPANESGPTPSGELIEFDVGIELKDLVGAEAVAKEVTDPTSHSYRRYLTPQQWESRFSPSVKADREVEASLRAAGIKITKVAPDRMTIVAEGTAEQIEAYFGTKLANYEVGEETVRLASSSLSAPTNVAPLITGVRGSTRSTRSRRISPAPVGANTAATARAGTARHGGSVTVTDGTVTGHRPPKKNKKKSRSLAASATRLPAPPITGRNSPAPCRPSATVSRTHCPTRCADTSPRSSRAPTT